ncbi:MAG: alanine dehydrogenase [Acholeplasmataceae bacterium]|nr:alanine dehydrogenase [Acholeplasmataceae bacterium]
MIVGTVKEIKNNEFRVGLTPSSAREYVHHGHHVLIEAGAGLNSGFEDRLYEDVGATIVKTAKEVWTRADMVVKVKEPLEAEFPFLREDLIVYTYLHLAANRPLTDALLASGCKGVAYETIMLDDHSLPCLKPMSEVAGRIGAIEGAKFLEKPFGGSGLLVSGVPGTEQANVSIIGAGVVGENALKMLVGMGARVTVLDVDLKKLTYLDELYNNRIQTLYSSADNIEMAVKRSDLVISAVLLPGGAAAPKLIKRTFYKDMRPGSVIVDVAIDQGGSTEVSKPTYHDNPTFVVDGVTHYCVANMPGAVPRTSTVALNNATLTYGLLIADLGLEEAVRRSHPLKLGVNTYHGKCTCEGVCSAFDIPLQSM